MKQTFYLWESWEISGSQNYFLIIFYYDHNNIWWRYRFRWKAFKKIREFDLRINILKFKMKKLSPKEIIHKYNLNEDYKWKKIDILGEIYKLAYNL